MLKEYIIKIFLLTIILLVSVLGIQLYLPDFYLSVFRILPFFFLVTNLPAYLFLSRSDNSNPNKFYRRFMAAFGFKFFIYLASFIFFIFSYRSMIKLFTAGFFVFYIIYTVFSVIQMLKLAKK